MSPQKVYYRKFRKWKVLLCIYQNIRTGRTASGEAFLWDRAGTVYHADPEDTVEMSPGGNPEYWIFLSFERLVIPRAGGSWRRQPYASGRNR